MSEDTKKFAIIDRTNDLEAFADTKAEAVEEARKILARGGAYAPYTIYEAVAKVAPAQAPVTVIDLKG